MIPSRQFISRLFNPHAIACTSSSRLSLPLIPLPTRCLNRYHPFSSKTPILNSETTIASSTGLNTVEEESQKGISTPQGKIAPAHTHSFQTKQVKPNAPQTGPLWIQDLDTQSSQSILLSELKSKLELPSLRLLLSVQDSKELSTVSTYSLVQILRAKPSIIPMVNRSFVWRLFKELESRKAFGSLILSDWEQIFQGLLVQGTSFINPNDRHLKEVSQKDEKIDTENSTAKEYGIAVRLIQAMREHSIQPSSFIYTCLIRTLRQDPLQAFKIFVSFSKSPTHRRGSSSSSNSIITNKMLRTLLAILHNPLKAERPRIHPRTLEKCYHSIWQIVLDHRITLTKETYVAFLDCFAEIKDLEGLNRMQAFLFVRFKDEIAKDVVLYEALLDARFRADDYKEVLNLFGRSRRMRVPLTMNICKYSMFAMEKLSDFEGINKMYEVLSRAKIPMDSGMIRTCLRSAGKTRQIRMVAHIYAKIRLGISLSEKKGASGMKKAIYKSSVYIPLIEALGKLASTDKILTTYEEYKLVRTAEIALENEELALGWANDNDMVYTLLSAYGSLGAEMKFANPPNDEQQKQLLEKRRQYRISFVPRKAMGLVLETLLRKRDLNGIKTFFEKEVLQSDHLALHWAYIIHHQKSTLATEKKTIASRIEHLSSLNKHSSILIPLQRFEKDLKQLDKQISAKIVPQVGEKGVLSGVYEALSRGMQEMSETMSDVDETFLWNMDVLIKDMEAKELESIYASSIGYCFQARGTVKYDRESADGNVDIGLENDNYDTTSQTQIIPEIPTGKELASLNSLEDAQFDVFVDNRSDTEKQSPTLLTN